MKRLPLPLAAPISIILVALQSVVVDVYGDDFYLWVEESGGDVVFRYSGSLDLTSATTTNYFLPEPNFFIDPSNGSIANYGDMSAIGYRLFESGIETKFGSGSETTSSNEAGDPFFLRNTGEVLLPSTYASGDPISGSLTFSETTLGALGVNPTPFSHTMTGGSNTIHFFQSPPTNDSTITPQPLPTASPAKPDLLIGRSFAKLKGNDTYSQKKAGNRQTLVLKREIFAKNKSKAFILMQNDGETSGEFTLVKSGDGYDGMKTSATLIGVGNIEASLKTRRFSKSLAPGSSAGIIYRLRTKQYFAGVSRDGDRHDKVEFRMSRGGQTDVVAMLNQYYGGEDTAP